MTFEEFFKKKKIDLDKLKIAEAELFAEFKWHYAEMGEKSFDHTKKYWFNELRRKYHTPEEAKLEKVKIENPLAEQTIVEALTEQPAPAQHKPGYTPKFRVPAASPVPAPIVEKAILNDEVTETPQTEETTAPKLGFKQKFRGAVHPKVNEEAAEQTGEIKPESTENAAPELVFKPKFKAVTPPVPKPVDEQPTLNTENIETPKAEETTAPKLGFKPKFRARVQTGTKEGTVDQIVDEVKPAEENLEAPGEIPEAKLGFKPRFKMKPKE